MYITGAWNFMLAIFDIFIYFGMLKQMERMTSKRLFCVLCYEAVFPDDIGTENWTKTKEKMELWDNLFGMFQTGIEPLNQRTWTRYLDWHFRRERRRVER